MRTESDGEIAVARSLCSRYFWSRKTSAAAKSDEISKFLPAAGYVNMVHPARLLRNRLCCVFLIGDARRVFCPLARVALIERSEYLVNID